MTFNSVKVTEEYFVDSMLLSELENHSGNILGIIFQIFYKVVNN